MRSPRATPALLGLLLAGVLATGGAPRAADSYPRGQAAVAEATPGDDSGIGGTGRGDDDSGIGGTGIYGTITGFGSIWVNGLRIGYDPKATVEINGRQAATGDLAVGQLVWVEAVTEEHGLWTERISVFSAAIGRIDALDPQNRSLTVSGHRIRVPGGAVLLDLSGRRLSDLSELGPGAQVDVSGLRHPDGYIVATRIAETAGPAWEQAEMPHLEELLASARNVRRLSVEGFLHPRGESGELGIDGLAVDTSALSGLEVLDTGKRVWLSGDRVGDRGLRAHRITPRPLPPLEPPETPGSTRPGTPPDGSGGDRFRPAPGAESPSLGASDLPQLMDPEQRSGGPEPHTPARLPGEPERFDFPDLRQPLESPGVPGLPPVVEPREPLSPSEPVAPLEADR